MAQAVKIGKKVDLGPDPETLGYCMGLMGAPQYTNLRARNDRGSPDYGKGEEEGYKRNGEKCDGFIDQKIFLLPNTSRGASIQGLAIFGILA